jgi:hypothetical protein
MIYEPWHGYSLHPCANKGHTLSAEEKAVIPVFKRPEYSTESFPAVSGSTLVHEFFSKISFFFGLIKNRDTARHIPIIYLNIKKLLFFYRSYIENIK